MKSWLRTTLIAGAASVVASVAFAAGASALGGQTNKYTGPEEQPSFWFNDNTLVNDLTTTGVLDTAPVGRALVVKSVQVSEEYAGHGAYAIYADPTNDPVGACESTAKLLTVVQPVPGDTTTALNIEPGFTVPSGDHLCASDFGRFSGVGTGARVFAQGYTVPSTFAPS
jgi:hypothetical protein